MREELQQQIRRAILQSEAAVAPHDLPTSAQVWSRLQFRLAYRPPRDRYAWHASTLLVALYVLAFLLWTTWSGWLSASLLAVLASAAAVAVSLLLRISRIFRS
jgi:uncharacterized membrane protein (DUF485 family)